jgi:hypothetical protein
VFEENTKKQGIYVEDDLAWFCTGEMEGLVRKGRHNPLHQEEHASSLATHLLRLSSLLC